MSEKIVTGTSKAANSSTLTTAQRARIERNQAKAQKLREAKLVSHPYKNVQK